MILYIVLQYIQVTLKMWIVFSFPGKTMITDELLTFPIEIFWRIGLKGVIIKGSVLEEK